MDRRSKNLTIRRSVAAALLVTWLAGSSSAAADRVDYARQVKPLLASRCLACHGALQQKGGLRVDTARALIEGGDTGPAIVPGSSGESAIIERVSAGGGDRMPPSSEGEGLTAEQVALLKAWIDAGAAAPADERPEPDPRDHWAFRAPVGPPVPSGSARNPIDAFLAAAWAERGLKPQPMASRRILLRRVSLDLVGLPPTAEEAAAFEADPSPDAYEKVVDRLLASPHHGERWGRHWMDVWRYSDWWGLGDELRNSQKHIWHWRDWIVESLNADLGYDQMLREMLAADELYPDDLGRLRATGFLARPYFRFNRNTWLEEVVEHTGKAFLGLTLNCAKCHDHKYDPISQADYYRVRAFFEPYQLRTDAIPGATDLDRDGIPRAFDCNPDAPTFLFVRGDESRPARDRPLKPGLPPLLCPGGLAIEPVKLPVEASKPGLRLFVAEDQLREAAARIGAARTALDRARTELSRVDVPSLRTPPRLGCDEHFVHDDFDEPDPDTWEAPSGSWTYRGGRAIQGRGDEARSILRVRPAPPVDFQARVRLTITGGGPWRSAGLSFDTVEGREVLVYLSAYEGGPKLQVSYRRGGVDVYPPEAAQHRKVAPGMPTELTVRVRGRLVNVEVDGKHALAYRLPVEREPGSLALLTYAATAEFDRFDLVPLPTTAMLIEPPGGDPLARAQADVELAAKVLAAAEAQPDAIRARAAADRARFRQPPASDAEELAARASRLERRATLAKAEEDLARSALSLLDPARKDAAPKAHGAAKAAVEAARVALAAPGTSYMPIVGSRKSPESNVETEESRNRSFPTASTGRRAALARWMTTRGNPLTARVAVNHIWMHHFGTPLVPTVFDFGRKGTPPTHPALLDWLATDFMDHGWSMKRLHRLIVTSDAYRRTSSSLGADPATLAADPENRGYWRGNPVRMEAQVVRDSLIHLAGVLDPTLGGPPVPANDETSRRRSLYFFHSHNDHPRFLATFDDASVLECYRRSESIVPAQALALSNSKLALTMASRIGERLHGRLGSVDDPEFVRAAFETILGDVPTPAERDACERALSELKTELKRRGIPDPGRRARDDLVQALLNHNDFVTIR